MSEEALDAVELCTILPVFNSAGTGTYFSWNRLHAMFGHNLHAPHENDRVNLDSKKNVRPK
jgi:hypothetical protein